MLLSNTIVEFEQSKKFIGASLGFVGLDLNPLKVPSALSMKYLGRHDAMYSPFFWSQPSLTTKSELGGDLHAQGTATVEFVSLKRTFIPKVF